MQLDTIIQTLLSAAAFLKKPIADAAGHSIKELFDTACHYLKRKFGEHSDGAKVLDLAVETRIGPAQGGPRRGGRRGWTSRRCGPDGSLPAVM